MNYKKTMKCERNLKLKEIAKEIYDGFMINVNIKLAAMEHGKFVLYNDDYKNDDKEYVEINNGQVIYQLNGKAIEVSPEEIFNGIRNGLDIVVSVARRAGMSDTIGKRLREVGIYGY